MEYNFHNPMKNWGVVLGAVLLLSIHPVPIQVSSPDISSQNTPTYFLPTVIVADYWFFLNHGQQSVNYIYRLMTLMNSLYFRNKINVSFSIESIDVHQTMQDSTANFTYTDFGGGEIASVDLIDSVDTFHSNYYPVEYNLIFLSGQDFDNNTIGFGYQSNTRGTIDYTSIIQATSDQFSDIFIATTIAHELGHNLGAYHDQDTNCRATPGIMSTTIDIPNPETTFSDCSRTAINIFLATVRIKYLDSSFPLSDYH